MDFIAQLGPLAFVSRMRRLAETVNAQAGAVYQQYGLDFDPKCFPVFWLLSETGPMSIMEIADRLGFSHPAIIQLARQLEQEGLIVSEKSATDGRKRILRLSDKGLERQPDFRQVWDYIRAVNTQLLSEQRHNLLWAVEELETALAERAYLNRFSDYLKERQQEEVTILEYQPAFAESFKQLNLAWIEQYFAVEEHDLEQLNHPEDILAAGGYLFFAQYRGEIVGTVALVADGSGGFELAKMAVDPQVQGKQIGKKLGQAAVEKARQMGVQQVWLESNTRLHPAIELYRKLGFYKVEMASTPYARANIKMKLDL